MNEMRGCSIFCAIRPVSGCRACTSRHLPGNGQRTAKLWAVCGIVSDRGRKISLQSTGLISVKRRTEIQRFLSQMRYPYSQHRNEKASACIQPPLSSDLPAVRRRPRNGLHGVWHWERPLVFPSDRPIQWGTAGNGGLPERTTLLFCLSEMCGSQKKTVIELFLVSKAEE